jgi:hypothetical protein
VEVLTHERAGLAPPDEEEHAERVEAGEERAGEPDDPEDVAVCAMVHGRGEDRVLREEPGERRDADQGE